MKLARRLAVGFTCLLLSFSMILQQTQAYPILWNDPSIETTTFRPGFWEALGGHLGLGMMSLKRGWQQHRMSNRGQGAGPRGAASDAGIPYRWQAADTFLSVAGISGHVNLANGNLLSVVHLSDFGGLSQVSFDLFYNSTDAGMSTVGGWRHSYSDTLEYVNDNTRIWTTSDGRLVTFTKEDSTWNAPSGVRLELMYNLAPDEWTVTDKGHNQRVFDGSGGELLRVLNDAGNPLNMSYDGSGRLETITQPLVIAHGIDANKIEISYDCNGRIDEIALPRITNPGEILMPLIGRTMEMQYDAEGRLRDSAQIT